MAACFRLDREGARQMAASHPDQLKDATPLLRAPNPIG